MPRWRCEVSDSAADRPTNSRKQGMTVSAMVDKPSFSSAPQGLLDGSPFITTHLLTNKRD